MLYTLIQPTLEEMLACVAIIIALLQRIVD